MSLKSENNFERIELLAGSDLKYYDCSGEMYLIDFTENIIMRFSDAEIVPEEKKAQILRRVNFLKEKMNLCFDSDNSERIELKGRSGINYFDELGNIYFVDSEMVASNLEYDYAIYPDDIIKMSDNSIISKELREKVVDRVMTLCKERGMSPRLFYKSSH